MKRALALLLAGCATTPLGRATSALDSCMRVQLSMSVPATDCRRELSAYCAVQGLPAWCEDGREEWFFLLTLNRHAPNPHRWGTP